MYTVVGNLDSQSMSLLVLCKRADCLAVVGIITGVRIERHKLQSQQWRRDVV